MGVYQWAPTEPGQTYVPTQIRCKFGTVSSEDARDGGLFRTEHALRRAACARERRRTRGSPGRRVVRLRGRPAARRSAGPARSRVDRLRVKRPVAIVAALVLIAALVAIVPRLGGEDPHTPRPGHPETVAAAIALTYARGVQVGDAQIACGTMTTAAARKAGCGSQNPRPRACGSFS